MNFVTADLHFGHKNIMNFCPDTRSQYGDVDAMTQKMIYEWNGQVSTDDVVYILGDVCFMKPHDAVDTVSQLAGKKILIKGNHDHKLLRNQRFADLFDSVHDYLEITVDNTRIVMFHYPIAEWNGMYWGSVHFYGHVHGKPTGLESYRARDVGIDSTKKIVWKLEDAIADALKGSIKT